MITILFEPSYEKAYLYVPLLVISVVVHAINGNLGSLYTVFKKTKGALYSTLIGAIINVLLNLALLPLLGIFGACLTTFVGFSVTLLYRYYDTKKFVSLSLDNRKIIIFTLLIFVQLFLYYFDNLFSYTIRAVILVVVVLKNYRLLLSIVKRS